MMDNSYGYDAVNNILSLKNNAEVPGSNLMGGSSEYSYEYDDLYRLTSAEGSFTGSNHEHRYNLEMKYNSVGGILEKVQVHERKGSGDSWQQQKKTSYSQIYEYADSQPHAPIHIGDQKYSYDKNGNQTGWTHDVSGQRRQIVWDSLSRIIGKENRIRAIADNGSVQHYIYDASGTRVLKGKSKGQSIYVNSEYKAGSGNMGNYTVYVNPYLVLRSGGYTKLRRSRNPGLMSGHYYIEGQRIVSKLGSGLDNNGKGQLKAGQDKVNYGKKQADIREGIVKNLKFLGIDGAILTAGNSGKTPPGQLKGGKGGSAGGGKDKASEKFQYFYHPDHLGSSSYITDASGEVYQHLEYFAFGETFVEEHSNTHRTPYLFNGKELDEETGLYYYGARYYEPQLSIMLSVDRFAEKYPGLSPYHYTANNPVNAIDINGDSTFVVAGGNSTYSVVGGNLNGNDKGIYIQDGEGNFTGEKLGESLTSHSFFDDNGNAVIGAVIDPSSSEGQDFINNEIIRDDPGLIEYMFNATGGERYDLKSRGIDERAEGVTRQQHRYRGSITEDGTFGSARDFGNMGAGIVAGRKGLEWGGARFGFDALQSYQDGHFSTEGPTTQKAERIGHDTGISLRKPQSTSKFRRFGE